jgi:exosortase
MARAVGRRKTGEPRFRSPRFHFAGSRKVKVAMNESFIDARVTGRKTFAQIWVFISLCVISILLWWTPLFATFRLASSNDAYTHILLIVPLSVALVYFDSKFWDSRSRASRVRRSPRIGMVLLLLSFVFACTIRWSPVGASDDLRLSLSMLGLVLWWIGSIVLCFGLETFKSFLFPLCFLFLVVPLPQSAVNGIVSFLQYRSAIMARLLFQLARVPVSQDGIVLSIPGWDIEVAHECSSIRSSLFLVVTTAILAHLFLRSWWRKALLIALSAPLSIAKNGFRIFTITELGTRVDEHFFTGSFHRHGGIVFYGLAVVAVIALLYGLRRTEFEDTMRPIRGAIGLANARRENGSRRGPEESPE